MAIASNKCDLVADRVCKQEDVEAYARSIGAISFDTSAAQNKGQP